MLAAEIIAVGSELLTPERSDTNSLWITERLNEIGIDVMLKTIVGDDEPRLMEAIKDASRRSDIVITTGGLGPTEDDITRQVAAKAIGRELEYHDELEAELRERFKRWGREMPEINRRQAYIIAGSDIIPNPNGSAVGMMLEDGGKTLVVLPGPPRENQPMFDGFVMPRLSNKVGDVVVRRRILKVSGMGESAVDEAAAPIYTQYPTVRTAVLFNKTEVEIHLYSRAATPAEAEAVLDELAPRLAEKIGIAVFALNGETMEEVIGGMLADSKQTLAVAESCTGGLIGRRITEVAGSSAYFLEGFITYSNEAKMRTLGVPEEVLRAHGAVSAETAEAMAAGARRVSGADVAVSVTGIAGPGGGTDEKPVGTVFIGYAYERTSRSAKLFLPGDRYLIRWRASQAALDMVRRQLLKA
ncbi:MAG TPA: competence/damage-inducible protein A [Pyrinomonadaceae bacterium]|nr:competence/damage-inducible protein A [Pyrinomonadaceae bacterium]